MNWRNFLNKAAWLLPPLGLLFGIWEAWTSGDLNQIWQGLVCGVCSFILTKWLLNALTLVPEYTYRVTGNRRQDTMWNLLSPGPKVILWPFERVIGDLKTGPQSVHCQMANVVTHDRILHDVSCRVYFQLAPQQLSLSQLKPIVFILLRVEAAVYNNVDGAVREISGKETTVDLQLVQSGDVLKQKVTDALRKRLTTLGVVVDGMDFSAVIPHGQAYQDWMRDQARTSKAHTDNNLIVERELVQNCLSGRSQDMFDEWSRYERMGENDLNYPGPDYYPPRHSGRPKSPTSIP